MKNLTSLIIILFCVTPVVMAQNFAGGNGNANNPYQIENWEHLNEVRNYLSSFFVLSNNLTPETPGYADWASEDANDGAGWAPIGADSDGNRFTGSLDGAGHTIEGLFINRPEQNNVGLFGTVGVGGTIRDVHLNDVTVTGARGTGTLVGRVRGTPENIIERCSAVNGTVTGHAVTGGLVGTNNSTAETGARLLNPIIRESFADIEVRHQYYDITAGGSLEKYGGLVGCSQKGTIQNSYARGSVVVEDAENETYIRIGGIAGCTLLRGLIENSYSTGLVSFNGDASRVDQIGGLLGNNSTGPPGQNGTVNNSFWDMQTSGQSESAAGTGKTTAQMKNAATFTDLATAGLDAPWDFVDNPNDDVANDDIWDINPSVNNGYPSLTWQDFEEEIEITISGTAGWRMLSIPVEGKRIRDLMDFNELAGFPGANAYYGTIEGFNFEQAQAQNFFFFDPALYDAGQSSPGSSEPGWKAPDNIDQMIEPGRGFIWFFYDDTPAGDSPASFPLPTVIPLDAASGPVEPVGVSLTKKSDMSAKDAWNLVGNPYPSAIHPAELGAGNAGLHSLAAQIWNPATGSFEVRNFSGESSDIAIGQGFFVENDDLESFTIPGEARRAGIPPLLREQGKSSDGPLILRFRLEGEHDTYDVQTIDEAISLYMSEDATSGWDHYDVQKLTPLSAPYATLSFVGERNGNTIYKAQESQPLNPEKESVEIPVKLTRHYMSGSFALTWDMPPELPESIGLMLLDHHTGDEVSLREASEYRFTAFDKSDKASLLPGQPKSKSEATATSEPVPFSKALPVAVSLRETLSKTDDTEYRFGLILKKGPVGSELGPDFPQEVELAQNYPNPFNPVTVLSYGLPENAHVRLAVYDITGRRVAVLLDGDQKAGRHEISWDASHLSSGIYLYRLETDGKSLVRKMTLIK